jgi:hypothetical protein
LRRRGDPHPQTLFDPRDELTIDFTDLSLEVADREDRRVDLAGSFVEEFPQDQE